MKNLDLYEYRSKTNGRQKLRKDKDGKRKKVEIDINHIGVIDLRSQVGMERTRFSVCLLHE